MKQSKESHMKFLALRMQSNKGNMFSNLGVMFKIPIYKIVFEKELTFVLFIMPVLKRGHKYDL